MVTSDDEYDFDDLVLDERTLAVLDATERDLVAAIPSTSHPRSPAEQQPTKRLKTSDGWVPLQQQPHKRSSPSKGIPKSRFSLEDTDLPEITISNGFYSGPGRFFVGSQQSEPPTSPRALPNNTRLSTVDADSDVVMLPTQSQQGHPLREASVVLPDDTSRKLPLGQPNLALQSNRERNVPTSNVVSGPRKAPIRHAGPSNTSRTSTLTRSSSFSDAMRAAVRSALSEVDSPAIQRSSSAAPSDSPSSQAAAPRAHLQEPVPNPPQATVHSRLERFSHSQRRERSLPPQYSQPHRPPSQHEASGAQLVRASQVVRRRQRTPWDQTVMLIGGLFAFQDENETLRSQVEELKRQGLEQQRLLDQAVSEKRSKIGEVEILRSTLERVKTTHNEETEKLREAKENLEAAQAAARTKLENELNSLRTQLIFKQHEMETSRRAVPRVPAPSQPAGSSQAQRSDAPSTPRKSRATVPQSLSQRPVAPPPRLSTKGRPPPPGFVNAFVMPPQKKGKEKAHASTIEESQRTREQDLDLSPLSLISIPLNVPTRTQPDEGMEIDGSAVSGQTDSIIYPDVDFHMDFADDLKMVQPIADVSRASKSFDWVNWMRQLILSHATSPRAPSTIQLLLAQPPLGADHTATFQSACTSLISVVVGSVEYDPVVRVVANSLAQITNIMLLDTRLGPLISTLNLLRHLVICLPSFVKNLLKSVDDRPCLETICAIIVNLLRPSNINSKNPEYLDLGKEVFSLLDAITYSLPAEYQSQLAVIPQTADVLTMMLSKDQSPSFLENSARTLFYLSTRAGIFRSLLSFPEDTPEGGRNLVKLPQVDRMCALLMDSSRTSAASHSIRASVLTTLISLALAHEDALLILSESPFFIPSLVKLLADLSTALWEEDPELTVSEVLLSETVAGIARSMLLLHYVIFRIPNGPASLRARLQAAPPRHFNGIGHQFVVALGRLSYAEPPDEVSGSDRMLLEQLADPARDVMDLVVAGPESESVWSLFQEDEGRGEERRQDGQQGDSSQHDGFEDSESVMEVDMSLLQDSSLEYI